MFRIVEFPSEDATLRGKLFPCNKISGKSPTVIMAHGFSATINGMVADDYAKAFCRAGFYVLLFDHRNFGISGGEPRQEINKWVQARGYRDAINFVTTIPEIDASNIAIWGTSMSAAEVLVVGAIDSRVKVVIAQVPAFGDQLPPEDPDGTLFFSLKEIFLNGKLEEFPEEIQGPMPVVSFDQKGTPSALVELSAFRWFIEYGGRYDTNWENTASIVNKNTPVPLDVALCAPHLKVPILMVVSKNDEMEGASSDITRKVFEMTPQPKEFVEIGGGHFGLMHYPSPIFNKVSKTEIDFLTNWLK